MHSFLALGRKATTPFAVFVSLSVKLRMFLAILSCNTAQAARRFAEGRYFPLSGGDTLLDKLFQVLATEPISFVRNDQRLDIRVTRTSRPPYYASTWGAANEDRPPEPVRGRSAWSYLLTICCFFRLLFSPGSCPTCRPVGPAMVTVSTSFAARVARRTWLSSPLGPT